MMHQNEAVPRVHIVPLNDDTYHFSHGNCCNALFVEEEGMVIHHAKDKREQCERQGVVDPAKPWAVFLHEVLVDGELTLEDI
jgi:hypothetical protein